MSRIRVLALTNNLTHGAVAHQLLDISKRIDNNIEYNIGVLCAKGPDRIDPSIAAELNQYSNECLEFKFGMTSFFDASTDFIHRASEFDVLHTNLVRSGIYGRVLQRLASDTAIVSTEHAIHTEYNRKQYFFNTITLPLADYVVCVSSQVRKSIWTGAELFIPNEKIKIIYNCVDPNLVDSYSNDSPKKSYSSFINEKDLIVGTVGRLVPAKNHEVIIRAMYNIIGVYPSSGLVIIGDGPLRPKLEALAEALGIGDDILFTGHIDRSEVYTLLHKFDTFVMPSQYEGMGIAVAEAMLAKKSIVASDIPVFREILNKTAYYANPNDHREWSRTLINLFQNPSAMDKTGKQARKRAKTLFSPNSIAEQYSQLYWDAYAEVANEPNS